MPLTFPARSASQPLSYTAAHISELTIDLLSKRTICKIIYGDVVGGNFNWNRSIPTAQLVLDGAAWNQLAALVPDGTKTLYNTIRDAAWEKILALGLESGTIS